MSCLFPEYPVMSLKFTINPFKLFRFKSIIIVFINLANSLNN